MKLQVPLVLLLSLTLLPTLAMADSKPWKTVEIWPDGAPNEEGQEVGEEAYLPVKEGGDPLITRLSNVTNPRIDIYPAPGDGVKPAILIYPGGGYHILAMKHEGTMVAEFLNEIGYTALVVTYRVPRREGREPHEAPVEDARQALQLAHDNAEAWNIDPDQLGVMGFSAGGNLAAHAAYAKGVSDLPKTQQADFAVLIYPAYLQEESGELNKSLEITKSSVPAFIAHAHDDRGGAHVNGSITLYMALSEQDTIPTEMHIYSKGGHGFGILDRGLPVNQWPSDLADWLKITFGEKE